MFFISILILRIAHYSLAKFYTYRLKVEGSLFLGLDSSTQGLKAVAINNNLEVVGTYSVHYETDFPEYQLSGGVISKDGTVSQSSIMVMSIVLKQ